MPQVFSLEAFNARHGDALLLHVGTPGALRRVMIDGGPAGTYKASVKPRLAGIAKADKNARIDHVILTHLDDDHVRGILDYLKEVEAGTAPLDCASGWFNVLDDIEHELPAELASWRDTVGADARSEAVVASVAQGVDLAAIARRIPLRVNGGSGMPLIADQKGLVLDVLPGVTVTLVAPSRKRVDALFKEWQKQVAKDQAKKDAVTADYVDRSVFNLSSLVLVVEVQGPRGPVRMLLTGDSRGDDALAGLADAGFLDAGGKAHFDLFKIAHHGSDRDYAADFFQRITADRYLISADGNYANPSEDTLVWLAQSRGKDEYEVWLTNHDTSFADLRKNLDAAVKKVPALQQRLRFQMA